jgi:hypothetical protein
MMDRCRSVESSLPVKIKIDGATARLREIGKLRTFLC